MTKLSKKEKKKEVILVYEETHDMMLPDEVREYQKDKNIVKLK